MSNTGNLLSQINNTEVVEKKVDVEQALARMRRPLDLTNINIEVYGVYSLPDAWKTKVDDPSEQLYTYELDVCGVNIKNAKLFPRELTEEEKAEIEAAKNTKGKQPPPKDPKKKEEEPSKEELERIERERKEKEERERKLKEEWDALDEETKFYRTSEDIYKEPCVKFHNQLAAKRIESLQQQLSQTPESEDELRKDIQAQILDLQKKTYVGAAIAEKSKYELVEFEEFVNYDKGCWIKFMKLPPPEEEILDPKAAAAKKAPPKGGKGAPTEDLKPFYGRAWLNLEDLLVPGGLETKQRVFLETCPPQVKKMGDDGVERYQPAEEYDNVFEQNRTYIFLKITLTEPITPTVPEQPEPLPHEVVPVKQFIKWPFSKDPTDDFKKQITLAVESLAKEYYTMFQNELETEAQGGKSDHALQETFEERKKEFLYEINTSGKYHILKEKLKKTIVRIVKEHFKMTGSIKGLKKDERDHFYSKLYAYLVNQMRTTVQQLVERKRNELHENITVPSEQFAKERDYIIESTTSETLADRYKRLSSEYENLYCNVNEAEQYMLKYVALFEGDPEKMLEIGKFYLRINKYDKANDYLRDAYSFQIKNQQVAMIYACYLIQQQRFKESIVILNRLAQERYEEVRVNILLSIAYDMDSDPLVGSKYRAISFVKKMRDYGIIPDQGSSYQYRPQSQPPIKIAPGQAQQMLQAQNEQDPNKSDGSPAYQNKRLSVEHQDNVFLDLAEFLADNYLFILGVKVLSYVQNQDQASPNIIRQWQIMGRIKLQKKNYEEALQQFKLINERDKTNLQTLANIGHCLYFLKRYQEAEEAYQKFIRIRNFSDSNFDDPYVLQRLGYLYMQTEKIHEASEIFDALIQQPNPSSFVYLNTGITYIDSIGLSRSHYQIALALLNKANQLDPNNPDIWGYITFQNTMCMYYMAARQSFQQALKLNISNSQLLAQIAYATTSRGLTDVANQAIERAFKIRAPKDSKHEKKLEKFLKSVEGVYNKDEITAKFKELLVDTNCLKEDDQWLQKLITNQEKIKEIQNTN